MRSLDSLRQRWRALLAIIAALGALALLWAARAEPLQPAPFVRVDALSGFFSFALLGGIALAALVWPASPALGWRIPAGIVLLLLAWSTTLTPIVTGIYLLLALLELNRPTTPSTRLRAGDDRRPTTSGEHSNGGNRWAVQRVWRAIQRGLWVAPEVVAAGALVVGYGALAARGALRYDARTAGAALDSFAFWFVLLAAAVPLSIPVGSSRAENQEPRARTKSETNTDNGQRTTDNRQPTADSGSITRHATHDISHPLTGIFRLAWLYPLARLYSLGPWNTGWAFATLLLGGGVALWAALAALARPADRRILAPRSFLGLALAGLGLGTGAGIAAGCYGVLTYLLLVPTVAAADENKEQRTTNKEPRTENREQSDHELRTTDDELQTDHATRNTHWLLSGAIPLTAPFVAAWMLVGASVAGGVALLAGVAWLVMLLSGLTAALAGAEPETDRRALLILGSASVALGIGAPLITLALIQPVIEQLQGGLTPYGDVNIWPWIGLATIDAGHTPVTTLPSIAVAAFMLVLSALVYLIARLRGVWAPEAAPIEMPTTSLSALLASLRDEVPWLGALAPRPKDEERGVDRQ